MSEQSSSPRASRRSVGLSPIDRVKRYHQETKHEFMRYARSLGFLDWANQPDPFRRYIGTPLHRLPLLPEEQGEEPKYDDLYVPGRIQPRPVTIHSLSRFLEYALSITAWKQAGEVRWALRSNPSSGNLHPTEGYVLVRSVKGLASDPALYHYAPKEHGLERRALIPNSVGEDLFRLLPEESFLFGLSSIYWREAWKYGERAFRYCHHDVGHALGSARLAAAALGWRLVILSGLTSEQVNAVLGVERAEDYSDSEREHGDCLAVVWPDRAPRDGYRVPTTLPGDAIMKFGACAWQGKANRLSVDEPLTWDIIDDVAEVVVQTHPASGSVIVRSRPPLREEVPVRSVSAHQVIHQRRSAVAFDGRSSISVELFYRMLWRVMPVGPESYVDRSPPWDLGFFEPRVHLILFVHLVDGLTPGLYCLVRDAEKVPLLKGTMTPTFTWEVPSRCPASLPFYRLAEGDARRVAAQVSCHQDIAGASAFSLGMLAEFDGPLQQEGPGLYPRLFWECGVIGQVLYLEAEAADVRATGIGCFFDDPVHEVVGLQDARFQSLYHFTVGGAVDDARLTTLPPYPDEAHTS
ncbi:hypothetical protein YTPLAS18_16900 [Nitrospira sp.]|nr:hypothetical protein YTPLAS18_16900 [Nitrospira sp.]